MNERNEFVPILIRKKTLELFVNISYDFLIAEKKSKLKFMKKN